MAACTELPRRPAERPGSGEAVADGRRAKLTSWANGRTRRDRENQSLGTGAMQRAEVNWTRSGGSVHSRTKRNMAMKADIDVLAKLGEEGFDG